MAETIYHYTSGNGLMGIFNSSELHCSHISFLNDPTEHKYFEDVLNKLFLNSPDCKQIYSDLYNPSYFGVTYDIHKFYVLSFSKNPDSLSMWNYYAKGNGYNLGLRINNIIERNKKKMGGIFTVELLYDETKQYQDLKKFIKSYKKELLQCKNNPTGDPYLDDVKLHNLEVSFNDELIKKIYTYKHYGYSREEEVRILIAIPHMQKNDLHYRISENGVIIEYIKLELDIEKDLRNITIHPLSSNLHLTGIKKFLQHFKTNKSFKIESSKVPFRNV